MNYINFLRIVSFLLCCGTSLTSSAQSDCKCLDIQNTGTFHQSDGTDFRIHGLTQASRFMILNKGDHIGWVGINEPKPAYNLHVNGNAFFRDEINFSGNLTSKLNLFLKSYGFGVSAHQLNYRTDLGASHVFFSGGTNNDGMELMRIQGNGYVGIGVAQPAASLHVGGKSIFNDEVTFKKDVSFGGDFNIPGVLKIPKAGYIQLGSDVAKTDNGTIAYQRFSDGIDIVGAGQTWSDRLVQFWAQGGTNFVCNTDDKGRHEIFTISHSNLGVPWIGTTTNDDLILGSYKKGNMRLKTDGNIIMGFENTTPPTISDANSAKYDLFVHRGILSEDYAVAPVSQWADYVFKGSHRLLPLSEVERFIKTYQHLPGIASENEVKAEGYSLKDMNVKFLEKIEELTLYAIEQDKKLKDQEAQITELQKQAQQVKNLAAQLEELKAMIKAK